MTMNKYILLAIIILFVLAVGENSAAANRIKAENLFVEAQKKLSSGDDIQAERLLKLSLQNDPSFTSAIWQLSQIYESRGKLEHARELLLRGLEQSPNASWAREKLKKMEKILVQKLFSEAEKLMSMGEYTAALPKLSLYHGIKPYDPIPLINLTRCHLALGSPQTAGNYIEQAYERDPGNPEINILMKAVERRISENSIKKDKERVANLVANYSDSERDELIRALEALLVKEPSNRWAREKLEELNLLSEKNKREEKLAENNQEEEKDEKAGSSISFPSINLKHVIVLLLAASIIILAIFIRKRGEGRHYPLQGNLNLIPILDIVSLINSNLKTGWLEVSGERANGKIFFRRGEIIHASYRAQSGKEAFHSIMNFDRGRYVFYNHLPKVKRTIDDPLSILLLSLKARNESGQIKKRKKTVKV